MPRASAVFPEMTPRLSREIIRKNSAYKVGRVLCDVLLSVCLLIGLFSILVFGSALWQWAQQRASETVPVWIWLCVCLMVILFSLACAIVLREFIHSQFDMADYALARHEPFKQKS